MVEKIADTPDHAERGNDGGDLEKLAKDPADAPWSECLHHEIRVPPGSPRRRFGGKKDRLMPEDPKKTAGVVGDVYIGQK